jgi:hypothetical protein
MRGQVCVVSFPSIPVISQHNLNRGLKLANVGIIGRICHERAISLMSCQTPIFTIYGLLYTTFGLGVRHTGPAKWPSCWEPWWGLVPSLARSTRMLLSHVTYLMFELPSISRDAMSSSGIALNLFRCGKAWLPFGTSND